MKIKCWLCGDTIESSLEREHFVNVHDARPNDKDLEELEKNPLEREFMELEVLRLRKFKRIH